MSIWISVISLLTFSLTRTETLSIPEDACNKKCVCEDRDGVWITSCENRGITGLSEVGILHVDVQHLFLTGNLLRKLALDDFLHYEGLEILHLGNNEISQIEAGAFNSLSRLKRLHLNSNKIEVLQGGVFDGLGNLEYLQMDYNYLIHIEASVLEPLRHLEVLILNDNLLSVLPQNLFYFPALTHLDLRGNRLKVLPYRGLLEHLVKLVELQLEENPWNCSCELVGLKDWLAAARDTLLAGDIVCETPFRLQGRNIMEISKRELCPWRAVSKVYEPEAIALSNILRSTRPTKSSHQSGKPRSRPTLRASSSRPQNYGPMVDFRTRSTAPLECPTACNCNLQISDLGLNVNCQERGLKLISDLHPKPYNSKKMYVTGNQISSVHRSDFVDTPGLDLLHLGNNKIAEIEDRAFAELLHLKRLYLNGNLIDQLSSEMFYGLKSLQFLYLEYNLIKEIQPDTFEQVPNLQLLFLNNNLLRALPDGLFHGLPLAQLNLRNNHLQNWPVNGILEDLRSLVQLDLLENPWDCSCEILPMKKWLAELQTRGVISGVFCEYPLHLAGQDLNSIDPSYICPNDSDVPTSPIPPSEESFPGSTITLEMALDYDSPDPMVPLSVLILTLLLILIASVFVAAGLFTMSTMKPHKEDSCHNAGFDIVYGDQSRATVRTSTSHIYEYVSPPPAPISQSTPYGITEDRFRDLDELNTTLASNSDEELRSIINGSEFSTSNRPSPLADDNFFYRDILARHHQSSLPCKHGSAHYSPEYNATHQFLHPERVMMMHVEPSRSEYWELKAKLNFEPDYLEVHEKRTTITQF